MSHFVDRACCSWLRAPLLSGRTRTLWTVYYVRNCSPHFFGSRSRTFLPVYTHTHTMFSKTMHLFFPCIPPAGEENAAGFFGGLKRIPLWGRHGLFNCEVWCGRCRRLSALYVRMHKFARVFVWKQATAGFVHTLQYVHAVATWLPR